MAAQELLAATILKHRLKTQRSRPPGVDLPSQWVAVFLERRCTGNKDIVLPAESTLSFKLLKPVEAKISS